MWGLGCILAEMINCAYNKTKFQTRAMFAGTSCFPLSPCEEAKGTDKVNLVSKRDQLKQILDIIGKQDEDDLSFITKSSVLDYHNSLVSDHSNLLRKKFPDTNVNLINLLTGLLQYNPKLRLTAKQCL